MDEKKSANVEKIPDCILAKAMLPREEMLGGKGFPMSSVTTFDGEQAYTIEETTNFVTRTIWKKIGEVNVPK